MTTAQPQSSSPLGVWAAAPFAIALVVMVRGAVLAKLWAWFVVPQFDVDHLGWLGAAGLSVTAQILAANDGRPSSPDDEPMTGKRVITNAITRSVVLLIAFGVAAVIAAAR